MIKRSTPYLLYFVECFCVALRLKPSEHCIRPLSRLSPLFLLVVLLALEELAGASGHTLSPADDAFHLRTLDLPHTHTYSSVLVLDA